MKSRNFYVRLHAQCKPMCLSILTYIERFDEKLLLLINHWNSPWADNLLWAVTQTYTWIPFYLMACYLLWRCYGQKTWKILLLIILAVGMADLVSSGILKPLIHRPRPSHAQGISEQLHLHLRPNGTYYVGGPYGFPSSHASNSSTIAILLYVLFRSFYRNRLFLAGFLASYVLLFCYTRPYFGVHYPSDIVVGWLLGTALCLLLIPWMKKNILQSPL